MTSDRFTSLLTGLREYQPFAAFSVELRDGQRFDVDRADALVVRDGVALFLEPRGVPIWFDHHNVWRINGITASSDFGDQDPSD